MKTLSSTKYSNRAKYKGIQRFEIFLNVLQESNDWRAVKG
jgi:hypothetical protein